MGQLGGNYFNPRQHPWLDAFYNRTRPGTDPFPNPVARPIHTILYGSGGSAYYGVNTWSTDPDVFFASSNYPEPDWLNAVGRDAVRAKNYGLKRIAYEGGQGLDIFGRDGNPSATPEQKRALNADPRMQTMVETYHDAWTSMGGELLVYYVNVGPEDWEFTPSLNTLNTPKLNAASAIINTRQRVPVTIGQEIPGTLVARTVTDASLADIQGSTFSITSSTGEPIIGGLDANDSIGMPVNTRNKGLYRVRVRAGASAGQTSTLRLHLNGQEVGTVTLTGIAGGDSVMTLSTTADITVPDEFNVIRVTTVSGSVRLHSLEFEFVGDLLIASASPLPSAEQGTAYSTTLTANGGTLPYSWSISAGALPPGLSLAPATGVLSGTPATAGNYSFTISVTDSATPATTSSKAFALAVAAPPPSAPVITEGDSVSVNISEDGIPVGFGLTLNASNPGGGTLAWSIASAPAHGSAVTTPTGSGTSATIGYTPAPDWHGSDSFMVRVADSFGGSDQIAVTVTVQPVNDAPVLEFPLPDQTAIVDQPFSFTVPANTFSDVDDATLAYSAALADGTPLPAWLAFDPATRSFSGTPGEADATPLAVTVTATDGGGRALQDTFALAFVRVNPAVELLNLSFDEDVVGMVQVTYASTSSEAPWRGINEPGAQHWTGDAYRGLYANTFAAYREGQDVFGTGSGTASHFIDANNDGDTVDSFDSWSGIRVATAGTYAAASNLLNISSPGDWAGTGVYIRIRNTTGAPVTQWTVAFDLFGMDADNDRSTLNFGYAIDNALIPGDLTYTSFGSQQMTNTGSETTLSFAGAVSHSFSATVPDGDYLVIALTESFVNSGSGIFIDNLSVTAQSVTPVVPLTVPAVALSFAAGQLQITFTRASADLSYAVQASGDLQQWTTIATDPGTVGQPVTVSDSQQLIANQPRFLRVSVSE